MVVLKNGILVGFTVDLMKLKLDTAQHSSLKLIKVRLHLVSLICIIATKELICKILSLVGSRGRMGDGLSGYKANLSPAKMKVTDIGLQLSLAIIKKMHNILREHRFFLEC